MIHLEEFQNKTLALKRELAIKRKKKRQYILELKKN